MELLDRIEITPSVEVIQPRAIGARNRNERQRFVLLHLSARVPYRGKAAV